MGERSKTLLRAQGNQPVWYVGQWSTDVMVGEEKINVMMMLAESAGVNPQLVAFHKIGGKQTAN